LKTALHGMETGASKQNNSLVHDITYRMCEVRRIVITYISLRNFTVFTLVAAFQITFYFALITCYTNHIFGDMSRFTSISVDSLTAVLNVFIS
jgi:hypothetical protein